MSAASSIAIPLALRDDALDLARRLDVEFRLLNDYQRRFPLVPEPFREIAGRLGCSESFVISAYRRMAAEGKVSRIGAVIAPGRVGASTLAAMAVPTDRVDAVAALVNARPEVNHNYEREHRYNLWFVAAARDDARLEDVLSQIETAAALPVLRLKLEAEYHIDLGFDLRGGDRRASSPATSYPTPLRFDCPPQVLAVLQDGLPIVPRPFAHLALKAQVRETAVFELIEQALSAGVLRRFGVVVRHRELGYNANAMCVWDVPEEAVGEHGRRLARQDGVTLCYRRRRALPDWPYNLYCMIHGRSRETVLRRIGEIDRECALAGYPRSILFSTRRFKQCGARYWH